MIYIRGITEKWSLESAAIRLATRHWCSHVEFVTCYNKPACIEHKTHLLFDGTCPHCRDANGDPFVLDMQSTYLDPEPVDTLGSRLNGGVQIRPYEYCRPTREEWYTAPHIEDAYAFGVTLIGSKYDVWDILGIAADEDWHTDGRYICSEFLAYCAEFERSGNLPFCHAGRKSLNPWLPARTLSQWITPRDLICFGTLEHVRTIQR